MKFLHIASVILSSLQLQASSEITQLQQLTAQWAKTVHQHDSIIALKRALKAQGFVKQAYNQQQISRIIAGLILLDLGAIIIEHTSDIKCFSIKPSGTYCVFTDNAGNIVRWDLLHQRCMTIKRICRESYQSSIRLYDEQLGDRKKKIKPKKCAWLATFFPKHKLFEIELDTGQTIVAASAGKYIIILPQKPNEAMQRFLEHSFCDVGLLSAASSGGLLTYVLALVSLGVPVDDRLPGSPTPLMLAAAGGYNAIVRFFIAYGADIDAESVIGQTALMAAAEQGHLQTVQLLVREGADVTKEGQEGNALELALIGGHEEVTFFLDGHKVRPDFAQLQDYLTYEKVMQSPQLIAYLISKGAHFEHHYGSYLSGLDKRESQLLTQLSNDDFLHCYLTDPAAFVGASLPANPSRKLNDLFHGHTEKLLSWSIVFNHPWVMQQLLHFHCTLKTFSKLFALAYRYNRVLALQYLKESFLKSYPTRKWLLCRLLVQLLQQTERLTDASYWCLTEYALTKSQVTDLSYYITLDDQENVDKICSCNPQLRAPAFYESLHQQKFALAHHLLSSYSLSLAPTTALIAAAKANSLEFVEFFLTRGGDAQLTPHKSVSALCYACMHGNLAMVVRLCDAGADLHYKTPDQYTPLMYAALSGTTAVVNELIARGVITKRQVKVTGDFQCSEGRAALALARKKNFQAIEKALLAALNAAENYLIDRPLEHQ